MNFLRILFDERGTTLAITRVSSGAIATAAIQSTRDAQVEAVVNGAIDSDSNIAADGVKAVALNSDVVNANNGLKQEANGSLSVDPSDTNPCLEITDGGVRVKVTGLINRTSSGLEFGISGDILLTTVSTARTGWTNVSSTYSNKFIRINATALSAGGADTHTHGAGSYAGPSHTHSGTTDGVTFGGGGSLTAGALDTTHTHTFTTGAGGTGAVTGTSASGDNVPAYMTLIMFQKD